MKIILIEDNKVLNKSIVRSLKENYEIIGFYEPESAIHFIEDNFVDVVISDIKLPQMNGIELLKKVKNLSNDIYVLLITGHGTVEEAVEAIKLGAYEYMLKPVDIDLLKLKLSQIEQSINFKYQNDAGANNEEIIYVSNKMKQLLDLAKRIAVADSNVLIYGETGTGKELLAKFIHKNSKRNSKTFIPINCSNLQESIFESELFGYKRGAFTGADKNKKGLVSVAHKGTLFLDEIGEMPLNVQAKLLRFIETKEYFPVGSEKSETSDVRIIAATNKHLDQLANEQKFRYDLYYRLNVINITIPPLRERKEDILPLAYHFLRKYNHINKNVKDFTDEAKELLLSYNYPGNVRELSNIIERALIIETNSYISPSSIIISDRVEGGKKLKSIDEVIKEHIIKVLNYTKYDKKKAAEILKIDRSTLYRKLKDYKIL